jgi:hypothetical protein
MNRRNLLQAFSIFPFVGKQKIRLDRIKKITWTEIYDEIEWVSYAELVYCTEMEEADEFFSVVVVKDFVKECDEVILEDGNKNILKVNKLNRGLVLLKLDLIKEN